MEIGESVHEGRVLASEYEQHEVDCVSEGQQTIQIFHNIPESTLEKILPFSFSGLEFFIQFLEQIIDQYPPHLHSDTRIRVPFSSDLQTWFRTLDPG